MGTLNKKCKICGEIKPIEEFVKQKVNKDGRRCDCKECRRPIVKKWQSENRGKCNKTAKKWRERNPERQKAILKRSNLKMFSTLKGRLRHNISNLIWLSLRGNKGNRHWEELVGYTIDQLKQHLEKQFIQGMSWENYGKWHIDHRIPVAVFNFEKPEDIDFKRCWKLRNLRPLWALENSRKQDKLYKPFQPSLMIAIN